MPLEAKVRRDFSVWGGAITEDRLFIGEMNCPSERDQIRNWFGFLGSVFSLRGATSSCSKLLLHFFFPVCFPGHLD